VVVAADYIDLYVTEHNLVIGGSGLLAVQADLRRRRVTKGVRPYIFLFETNGPAP
jgi:hypothetical protein